MWHDHSSNSDQSGKEQRLLPMKLEAVFNNTYRFHIWVYTNECNVVPTFSLVPTWTILKDKIDEYLIMFFFFSLINIFAHISTHTRHPHTSPSASTLQLWLTPSCFYGGRYLTNWATGRLTLNVISNLFNAICTPSSWCVINLHDKTLPQRCLNWLVSNMSKPS